MKIHLQPARDSRRARRGLSLVEVMVAVALGSLVLATVASLSLYATRTSMAMANYTDLDAKSRYALDVIDREVRQATAVVGFQTNTPVKSLRFTNAVEGITLTLSYHPDTRQVVLERTGQPGLVLLTECDRWDFALYQRTPKITATNMYFYPATNTLGVLDVNLCKLVSLSWRCSRTILAQRVNTESVQAAQVVLRNKQ